MPYTPELKELIKKVEATRAERVERKQRGEEVPFLDLDQRKERLEFHPDFKEEGRRPVAVGVSKGYKIAHEFADLVEALAGRPVPESRLLGEVCDVMVRHARLLVNHLGEGHAMRDFRKHTGWYMSGYPVGPEVLAVRMVHTQAVEHLTRDRVMDGGLRRATGISLAGALANAELGAMYPRAG